MFSLVYDALLTVPPTVDVVLRAYKVAPPTVTDGSILQTY